MLIQVRMVAHCLDDEFIDLLAKEEVCIIDRSGEPWSVVFEGHRETLIRLVQKHWCVLNRTEAEDYVDRATTSVVVPNYPLPIVKQFGEKVASALMDASIRESMHGLGGCKEFNLSDFDEDTHPYVLNYLKGGLNSVALVYAAMRTKALETSTRSDVAQVPSAKSRLYKALEALVNVSELNADEMEPSTCRVLDAALELLEELK